MCFCSETEKVHFRLTSEHDALISKAGEKVESSRVVLMEHLCAVKVQRSAKRYCLQCRWRNEQI